MEEPSQAPNNGHRFRRIATIPSTPRVPFVSLDLKTVDNVYTYLALIDRQGLLSIFEPSNPDDLKDWTLVDQFNVCGAHPPSRGDETSFKVRFDQNPTPLAYINSVSDDRSQLNLVVSALNDVKVYRSAVPTQSSGGGSGEAFSSDGSTHRLMFYEAVKLPRHPALVRDVAWAPFSVRGTDRIATACKDGSVRIFELAVSEGQGLSTTSGSIAATGATNTGVSPSNASTFSTAPASTRSHSYASQQRQQPQSSLTSAITGRSGAGATQAPSQSHSTYSPSTSTTNTNTTTNTTSSNAHSAMTTSSANSNPHAPGSQTSSHAPYPSASPTSRTSYPFAFATTLASTSTLPHAHPDAWSLSFDSQGQVLLTNGADGVTKIWRKSVLGGQWLVFAGQEVLDGDNTDSSDDDDDEENGGAGEAEG